MDSSHRRHGRRQWRASFLKETTIIEVSYAHRTNVDLKQKKPFDSKSIGYFHMHDFVER